ncbi:hypothetical protein IJJ46_03195 [Candidatus Saccharibacteria bacterium]|nr:hypothetical protein [Candidatus Saccharibacteria bacterium]
MYKPTEYEIAKIKQGEADIEAGRVYDWKEVEAEINEMIRVAKLKRAQQKGGANAGKVRRPALVAS